MGFSPWALPQKKGQISSFPIGIVGNRPWAHGKVHVAHTEAHAAHARGIKGGPMVPGTRTPGNHVAYSVWPMSKKTAPGYLKGYMRFEPTFR